jgi:hypothetical protein
MPRRWFAVLCLSCAVSLGASASCGDEDGESEDGVCRAQAQSCDECPTGLLCGTLSTGGVECYTPCDTASDCAECDPEKVCGYGENDRQLCIENP